MASKSAWASTRSPSSILKRRDWKGTSRRFGRCWCRGAFMESAPDGKSFLTKAAQFRDVSRGNPKPFTLKGDDLVKARLTPESWRLEIVSDGSTQIEKPRKLDDNTALS